MSCDLDELRREIWDSKECIKRAIESNRSCKDFLSNVLDKTDSYIEANSAHWEEAFEAMRKGDDEKAFMEKYVVDNVGRMNHESHVSKHNNVVKIPANNIKPKNNTTDHDRKMIVLEEGVIVVEFYHEEIYSGFFFFILIIFLINFEIILC